MDIIPPNNIEAEQSVIGSLLLDREVVLEVLDILSPDDFYEDKHRVLFEVIATLFNENKSIDILTVSERLKMLNYLEVVGGISYLTQIINSVAVASHAKSYAKIVREKSKLRKIINKSSQLMQQALSGKEEKLPELLVEIEQQMNGLVDINKERIVEVKPLLTKLSEEMLEFKQGKRQSISTGFEKLDNIVDGFIVPHIWIIGGYTGQGKTFFTLDLLKNLMRNGMRPILFSTENSSTRNVLRLLGTITALSEMKLY